MYARLSGAMGWQRVDSNGAVRPFVLSNVTRHQGMITGRSDDGRWMSRPAAEVDALSLDGEVWLPRPELFNEIPEG